MSIKITGSGIYLPPKIEKSKTTAKFINESTEWIIAKTGVEERRISEVDVDEMGAVAARKALEGNGIPDLIINASGVPKQTIPDTSVFFQRELEIKNVPCFSIHGTCLSFLIALNNARALINSNIYKKILIISSDRGSVGRNPKEPESAALLGDGAAAILIEKEETNSKNFHYWKMNTWSENAELTEVRGGGTFKHPLNPKTSIEDNFFTMDGPLIYKSARKKAYKMVLETFKNSGFKKDNVSWVIPHQASLKAINAYHDYGRFEKNKIINIVSKTGNCVAASIPMALAIAIEDGRIQRGDLLYFIGTGAGLSMACALITY